ncbi:MAG: polysaccharide biosynthesis protein [Pseudomonadota bacterium]
MSDAVPIQSVESNDPEKGAGRELIALMEEPNPLVPKALDENLIIHARTPHLEAFNAFRELRADLLQRSKGRNYVCVITSLYPRGGATHVALNLASAIALDRSKTALIVDCNLYRPAVHSLLGVRAEPGLTDFLNDPDGVSISDIIKPAAIPRIRVIPAGGPVARETECLSTMNMRLLIHMLQQRYPDRFIIIDAPDMRAAADTRLLENYADFVCMVVPYGKATSSKIVDATNTFTPEKFAGVIFNRLPSFGG